MAVLLSDLGLVLSDFDTDLDYAYTGLAVSNPSSSDTDLFVNDHFPESIGSGVEYDTLQMGTLVPEPATLIVLLIGLVMSGFSKRSLFARRPRSA